MKIVGAMVVFATVLFFVVWWNEPLYLRTVTGMVQAEGSRFASAPLASGQKFAILLKPYQASEEVTSVAGGDGSLAVECVSTRCSVLEKGSCVELSCKVDHRLTEPSVVSCKMIKVLGCTP